jgi:ATP-binding cassette subfamily C protein LapB
MVDRVIVLDGGRIVADGPRDRILEALANGRVARAA